MIDLGHNHTLRAIVHRCKGIDDRLYGYEWLHLNEYGELCSGVVTVCEEKHSGEHTEKWTLESKGQGLSLKPSLLCEACEEHGFVKDGRWIGATGQASLTCIVLKCTAQAIQGERWSLFCATHLAQLETVGAVE